MSTLSQVYGYKDEKYRHFLSGLVPESEKNTIIGVRMPDLRRMAAKLDEDARQDILGNPDPVFYEERILKILLVNAIPDFDSALREVSAQIPYLICWAQTDLVAPAAFRRMNEDQKAQLAEAIRFWLQEENDFIRRTALVLLMRYFLGPQDLKQTLEMVRQLDLNAYYVSMAAAWLFCEAFIRNRNAVYPLLQPGQLDEKTRKRTIQKCLDSFRVADSDKALLRQLRNGMQTGRV